MKKNNSVISLNYYGLLAIVLLFCIFIFKLIYISSASKVDGVDIKKIALSRKTATKTLTASRGTIYSSNGETLAKNVNSYIVIAYISPARTTNPKYPHHVVDKEHTAEVLSKYLNMSSEYILSLLNYKGYQVELRPGGLNISEKLKQEIEALDLPGIDFIASTKRYYPFGDFASYVIGYAKKQDDESIKGELGIESYFDNELTGENGYTKYEQDAYGYKIADTPVIQVDAKDGLDVYLTIDSNIQMYLEDALKSLSDNYSFEWATVTIANAKTGAIVGSASIPSFNPNILNITSWNAPIVNAYEPGSTMKIYSFMAAIEEGIYDGDATYISGSLSVGKNSVTDWNKVGWGKITYDKGFAYSSNVAATNLGLTLGKELLVKYYKKFGFGSKTGIEISNEYSGILNPKYEIEVANVSFGQGLTTTPVQNIQALTSLANKGVILKPYIVEKIVNHDTNEIVYEGSRKELGTAVSETTVSKMLDLMYDVVNTDDKNASGRVYKTDNTTLVGKTGTAQIPSSKGGYESGTYANIRSFAGLFPYDNPEYIIYISVKKLHSSSSAIGKEVKKIVESIAKYKNLEELTVEEDKTKIITIQNYINKYTKVSVEELSSLGLDAIVIGDGERIIDQFPTKSSEMIYGNKIFIKTNSLNIVLPNMVGWSSNDATSYCSLVGLNCIISGYGNVSSQSIEEGEPVSADSILEIKLNR